MMKNKASAVIALILVLTALYVNISNASPHSNATLHYSGVVQSAGLARELITIASSPSGPGFVSVDGNPITTPSTFNWAVGSNHTLYAHGSVSLIDNEERLHLIGWNDSGSYIHKFTVPKSGITVTAIYQLQYYFAVTNGIDPTGQGWYDAGTYASATSSVSSSSSVLRNYLLDGCSQNLYNDFAADSQYNITDQETSPNGLWLCNEAGYGETGVIDCGNGTNVFFLKPQTSTSQEITHAALVQSTVNYANFTISVNVNTAKQLRQNSPPNAWEAAWLFFRFTNDSNFYYLLWDNSGVELGKKTGSTTQVFLVTDASLGAEYSFNEWSNWKITLIGPNIQAWLNGKEVINYTDTTKQSQLDSGAICMYCEDALVYWSDMKITAIPGDSLTNLQNPTVPEFGTFTTPNILMDKNHVVQFITSPKQ